MYDNETSVQRYREADLGSMSPEKMIVALYERLCRDLEDARTALSAGDRPTANTAITHAQAIVTELRNALDHQVGGGTIAGNLESLYDFVFQALRGLREFRRSLQNPTFQFIQRLFQGLLGPLAVGDVFINADVADDFAFSRNGRRSPGMHPTDLSRRRAETKHTGIAFAFA